VSELLTAALGYLERGWAVLPVAPRGKVPLTRHGLKDATTDRDQVERWWARRPDANIGVATGPPSGLLVVDLDGHEGLGSWARLEARYGVTLTLEASTGGGGVHLLYGYPADVDLGNSAGRLGEGIDTRARGGYVLVAPSVHPSGRRYAWSGSGETPIAPAPPWLVDLLRPPPPRPVPVSRREWQPGDDQRQLARFNGLLDVMARARPRQRNNQLYWCACRLRELLVEGAPREWVELLVDAGVATGLSQAEVRKTITSGLRGSTR
jgi:bifunctional DNA primase/polymerase-like protein